MEISAASNTIPLPPSGAFIERESYEKGFSDFFEKNLKPRLEKAEADRLILLEQYKKNKMWGYPLFIPIVFLAGLMAVYINMQFGIVSGIALGGFLYHWMRKPIYQYRSNVKEGIIAVLVKFFGELKFSESEKIGEGIVKNSDIAPSFESYEGSDYLCGKYDGVEMEMCEAELKQRDSKDRKRIVFKGEIFHIRLKKNFTGKTLVKSDAGMLGNALSGMFEKLERIKLEDKKFESIFEIYGSDQVEARYLLTTAFMERLLALRDGFDKTGTIQCAFYNDHLFIMAETHKDLFEAGPIEKSCLDTEDIHAFLAQMNSVFQVIEVLKLNKYTGL